MVNVAQGDVWWAELGRPMGSEPAYRRPVVVVQGNAFNRSALSTVVCVAVTSNLGRAASPGNVELTPRETGLDKRSVANVSQLVTVDRASFRERVGRIPDRKLHLIFRGIDIVLARP